MTKSSKTNKQTAHATSEPKTNWVLIGSILALGVVVVAGLFIWASLGSQEESLTIGERQATSEAAAAAEATAAVAQAADADALLTAYCSDNPARCIQEGDPDAAYVIYEFSDYSCPHCQTYYAEQYPLILGQLIEQGAISYITIPTPVLGQTPNTPQSVNATLCANDQGYGAEYHARLFEAYGGERDAPTQALIDLADFPDFDTALFTTCVEDEQNMDAGLANRAITAQAGVNSTPTLLLNGLPIEATFRGVQAAIQAP